MRPPSLLALQGMAHLSSQGREARRHLKPPSLLALLGLAHFADHYCLLIFPTVVLSLPQSWGLSYADALALGSGGYLAFALATLPAGWLGDRLGRVAVMRWFFPGLAAGLLLTGAAQSPWQLSAGLVVIGVAAALYHPIATALVVQMSGGSGRALAVNGLWGNMGVAAAALATGLAAAAFGWRWAFLLPAIPLIGCALLFQRAAREPEATRPKTRTGDSSATRLRPRRVLLLIALSAACGGLVFNGVVFALPKLFEERLSALLPSLSWLGLTSALVFALAAFAQLPVGALLDRYGARGPLIAAAGLQALLALGIALVEGPATLPLAALLVLLVFGEIPITAWLLARVVAPAWQARAYAVQHLLSLGIAAVVVPLIAGLHAATGGMASLFGLLGLAALAVALGGAVLLRPAPGSTVVGDWLPGAGKRLAPSDRRP